MKVRSGFVSNSSSSSFILASGESLDKLTVTFTFKLKSVVENVLRTRQEVETFVSGWMWGDHDLVSYLADTEWANTAYQKMLHAIAADKVIFEGQVSNDDFDNPLSILAYAQGFSKARGDFEIISDGE